MASLIDECIKKYSESSVFDKDGNILILGEFYKEPPFDVFSSRGKIPFDSLSFKNIQYGEKFWFNHGVTKQAILCYKKAPRATTKGFGFQFYGLSSQKDGVNADFPLKYLEEAHKKIYFTPSRVILNTWSSFAVSPKLALIRRFEGKNYDLKTMYAYSIYYLATEIGICNFWTGHLELKYARQSGLLDKLFADSGSGDNIFWDERLFREYCNSSRVAQKKSARKT